MEPLHQLPIVIEVAASKREGEPGRDWNKGGPIPISLKGIVEKGCGARQGLESSDAQLWTVGKQGKREAPAPFPPIPLPLPATRHSIFSENKSKRHVRCWTSGVAARQPAAFR
ncbi:MAG TPA: hypothetical protein VFB60_23050 [Ktedonobacteraceae bacterium]|nr:hypothetical protein [Ktedonobacteraceae bacterium]